MLFYKNNVKKIILLLQHHKETQAIEKNLYTKNEGY